MTTPPHHFSALSVQAQRALQITQDAPTFSQSHPETVGNLAGMELPQEETFNLSSMLENAQWASRAEEFWNASLDEDREAWWESLSDADKDVFEQYSGITVDRSAWDITKGLMVNPFKAVFHGTISVLQWLPDQGNRAARALNARRTDDTDPRLPQSWQDNTSYWARANTDAGRYYLTDVMDIAERAGWNPSETEFIMSMGLKFGLNRMLVDDPDGIQEAVTQTLLEYVTDMDIPIDDAIAMQDRILGLLADPEQYDLINEVVSSRYSFGRGVANTMGFDPTSERQLRNRNMFDLVSGVFDVPMQLLDVSLVGGKVIKTSRIISRGVSQPDDVVAKIAGARFDDIQAYANSTGTDFNQALVHLTNETSTKGNAFWASVNAPSRRMVDTIQKALNDDLAYLADIRRLDDPARQAAREGDIRPALGDFAPGGFARDHLANALLVRNPESRLAARLVERGAVARDATLTGTAGLRKLNPVIADVAVILRRTIQEADQATNVARVGSRQQAAGEGITEAVIRPYSRADILTALTDDTFFRNIIQGNIGGRYRHRPMMPGINALAQNTAGVKAMMRASIDWLNDSNYRLVSRVVQAGRFTEDLQQELLGAAGTRISLGDVLRGRPGGIEGDLARQLEAQGGVGRLLVASAASSQMLGKTMTFMTRLNPGQVIDLADDTTSLAQIADFAAQLPPSVADRVVNLYAAAPNLGQRVLIVRSLVDEVFKRTGVRDTKVGAKLAEEYLGKHMRDQLMAGGMKKVHADQLTGQIYSVAGRDSLEGMSNMASSIFGYQTSVSLALPDIRKVFAASRKGAFWSRVLGVDLFNTDAMNSVVTGFWAPAMLARPGFPLRASTEEALQFMMREGGIAYLRGLSASRWLRRREIRHLRAQGKDRQLLARKSALTREMETIPFRRGNSPMMWIAENLSKTRFLSQEAVDHLATRMADPNTLLASAWLGRMSEAILSSPGRFQEQAADWAYKKLAGKDFIRSVSELFEHNPEYRAQVMRTISGQNLTPDQFRMAQMGGGGMGPMDAPIPRSQDQALEELGIRYYDSGRFKVIDQDNDEFWTAFRDQMIAPFNSPDPLDQEAIRLFDEIFTRFGTDRSFIGDDGAQLLTNIREEFVAEVVDALTANRNLSDALRRHIVGSRMRDGRMVSEGANPWTTINADPNTLGWHGTRNAIDLDESKMRALQLDQEDSLQALRLVDNYRDMETTVNLFDRMVEDVGAVLADNNVLEGAADLHRLNPKLHRNAVEILTDEFPEAASAVARSMDTRPALLSVQPDRHTDFIELFFQQADALGLDATLARETLLGRQLRAALSDPEVSLSTSKVNVLRGHPDIDLTAAPVDVYRQVRRTIDDMQDQSVTMHRNLDQTADELLHSWDIDVRSRGAGLSEAEQAQLISERRVVEQLERNLNELLEADVSGRFFGSPDWEDMSETLASARDRVLRLEHRARRRTVDADPVEVTDNLGAVAMSNPRDVDSRLGTGGMWFTDGTYLSAFDPVESAEYALQGAGAARRVYAFTYDGKWRGLNLADQMPQDVYTEMQELVTQTLAAMSPDQLRVALQYADDRVVHNLIGMSHTNRLPASHRSVLRAQAEQVESLTVAMRNQPYDDYARLFRQQADDGDLVLNFQTVNQDLKQLIQASMDLRHGLRSAEGLMPAYWSELQQNLNLRMQRLGYTGAEVPFDRGMHRVVWEPTDLKVSAQYDPSDLRTYDDRNASLVDATVEWAENFFDELLDRLTLKQADKPTRLMHPDIIRQLRDGNAPTLEQIKHINFSDDASTYLINEAELSRGFEQQARLLREARQDPDAVIRHVDADGNVLSATTTDEDALATLFSDIVDHESRRGGSDIILSQDDYDRILRRVVDSGYDPNAIMGGFKRLEPERLNELTLAPLTVPQKEALSTRIWSKPYEVIGKMIDTMSRDPIFLWNYYQGTKFVDDFFWASRPGIAGLREKLNNLEVRGYADDLVTRGTRNVDVTVRQQSLPSELVSRDASGNILVDSTRIAKDFDEGLPHLKGTASSQGSDQAAEVLARLNIDPDELHTWLSRSGGARAYERFLVEVETARTALGHPRAAASLSEATMRQELEATYAALHRMKAQHLTAKPYISELTPNKVLEELDSMTASYRRLRAKKDNVGSGVKLDNVDTMLHEHPAWNALSDMLEDGRQLLGDAIPAGASDFAALRQVMERLNAELDEYTTMAAQWAFNQTRPHIDSVAISSYTNSVTRNMVPFQWAAERFIKRAVMTTYHSPEALFRAHITYTGMKNVGIIETDQNGEDYFIYPASHLMYKGIGKVLGVVMGGGLRTPTVMDENGEELPDDLNFADMVQFRGQMRMALPGLDEVGRPRLGPFMGVPLRWVATRFPSTEPMVRELIGDITMNPDRSSVSLLLPSTLVNLSRIPNAHENMNHAMLQGMQMLAANDLLPDDTDPASWELFSDRLEEQMKIIAGVRAFFGFAGMAPAQIQFSGAEIQQELFKLIEMYGLEDGYMQWQERYPDATAWQVFGTVTEGGATLPATEEAWRFMDENPELIDGYKLATPYLVPGPINGTRDDNFSHRAYAQQFASELRRRRTPDEMYRALRYAQAAPEYFANRDMYRAARLEVEGTPAAQELDAQWAQHQLTWQTQHPTFWRELTSNERQIKRRQILDELRAVRGNQLVPENTASVATFGLLDEFDQYESVMNSMRGINNAETREYRRQVRERFGAWAWRYVQQNAAAESFYYRIVVPELGLDDATMDQIQQATLTTGAA